MKRKHYTEEQIIGALKEHATGAPVASFLFRITTLGYRTNNKYVFFIIDLMGLGRKPNIEAIHFVDV